MDAAIKLLAYIRDRLNERSTWMLFVAGISGASAIPYPWSIGFMLASFIAAFIPDGKMR